MSTTALEGLLSYLYGTLSPSNMRWVGEHLIEYAKKEQDEQLRPFTMQELNARIDQAEAEIAAGLGIDDEDVWRELEEEFAREDAEEDALQLAAYHEEEQLATV
ncbi:MAG: hypothetical protein IK144_01630 [Bacteroidaceae bacterium]|nr:hypothetical protein [Bacteroidaceae bacterium]